MIARLLQGLAVVLLAVVPARAMDIQRVVSSGGVEAWLVENHAVPMIAVELGFHGGSRNEAAGKEGTATMMAGLLDEGAGPYDSLAFQRKLEAHAIAIDFDAGRDTVTGSLRTLTAHRDEAFDMLRLALTEPRFDDEPVARVRGQMHSLILRQNEDPDDVAVKAWFETMYPGHAYARPTLGTDASVDAIAVGDLKSFLAHRLARDQLKITVVGDIDAATLKGLLDKTFGKLPAKADPDSVPEVSAPAKSKRVVIKKDNPQTVVVFGGAGLKRDDPEFYAATVLNYILGGAGFASRLTEEVREKRGLAYSVYTSLMPLDHSGAFIGSVGTENGHVKESLAIIEKEIAKLLAEGATAEELKNAKTYLTGSYPLRFDTSGKIAQELVGIQLEDLGIDYVNKRNALIEAVTLDDLKRVAPRFLQPDRLIETIVGEPKGL